MNRPFGQCRQAVRHPRPFFSHRVAVTGYQTSCVRYRVQATLILLSHGPKAIRMTFITAHCYSFSIGNIVGIG